jgi:hypothetical protein
LENKKNELRKYYYLSLGALMMGGERKWVDGPEPWSYWI